MKNINIYLEQKLVCTFSLEQTEEFPSYFENKARFSDKLAGLFEEHKIGTFIYSPDLHGIFCTLYRAERKDVTWENVTKNIVFFDRRPGLIGEDGMEKFSCVLTQTKIPNW